MNRPPILSRDLKLLWGNAAARCAICRRRLTTETSVGQAILGEMAHIVADRPEGPRGDRSRTRDFLRSYENLILLCSEHHRLVDQDRVKYTVEELARLKQAHEAWVREWDGTGEDKSVKFSYVIVNGYAGLHEMRLGRDSEVLGSRCYDFRIIGNETLEWAFQLQELSQPWVTWPESLDWEALRALGAPIDPLRPVFPLKRELVKRGIDSNEIISSEFTWVELSGNNCAGVHPVEELASLDPSLQARSEWIERLTQWILKNIETRLDDDVYHALLPIVRVREPLLYCLHIDTSAVKPGSLLGLYSQGRHVWSVVSDRSPIIVPLGCLFEAPALVNWLIHEARCSHLDAQGEDEFELSEVGFATKTAYVDDAHLDKMIGPHLILDQYAVRDERTGTVERGNIRLPYRMREYINCYFYGGSCPEVFYRIDGSGWRHAGPVLVGALGAANTRAETAPVTQAAPGEHIEVLILEVPGEIAYFTAELVFVGQAGRHELLAQYADVRLGRGEQILHRFVAEECGRVELRISGYFVRTDDVLTRHPRRAGGVSMSSAGLTRRQTV
ncbi:HNH endonuclease [Nannocystis sp. SCPEA4]|uniref:HNH endonuclease n=1 Tax=Nannocystis sp. SCPEA4 TaxID=2996787 RepID=UPI00226F0E0E|nr:HNH endonuclease [Nannocystis sp. SCPEA4]MCY1056835.1 hypothetical protein [Nannocystis sp. SCPEA4]